MTRRGVKDMALAIFFATAILDNRCTFARVPKKLRDKVRAELNASGYDVNEQGELVEVKD